MRKKNDDKPTDVSYRNFASLTIKDDNTFIINLGDSELANGLVKVFAWMLTPQGESVLMQATTEYLFHNGGK